MTKFVKVYGERNTGTNYLEQLIKLNFDIKILPGVLPEYLRVIWDIKKQMPKLYDRYYFVENFLEFYFQITKSKYLGWKHSLISADILKSIDNLSESVFFVTITKNPYSWLLSLHNRPYHSQIIYDSFEEFLIKPWKTTGRDNFLKDFSNPIEMWNVKNNSYRLLAEKYPTKNVRYEDLLGDFKGVLNSISDFFDIDKKFDSFKNINRSTKGDKKDFDFYKKYYLDELWKDKLSDKAIYIINKILDEDILEYFGYKKIKK